MGVLYGIVRGDRSFIEYNDCGAVVRTLPTADLQKTSNEMEFGLEVTRERCPHCGNVNLMPGFPVVLAYTCDKCGAVVRLSDDPEINRIFGPREEDKDN